MGQEWFYRREGKKYGPIQPGQLKQMAANGELEGDDMLWREGMAQWVVAKTVKGLFPDGGVAATPPSRPAPAVTAAPPARRRDDDDDDNDRDEDDGDERRGRSRRGRDRDDNTFDFHGEAGSFFGTFLLAGLLAWVTARIGTPWAWCMMQRWKAENTSLGGRRLRFIGTGGEVFWKFIGWGLLTWATCGIGAIWVIPWSQKWIANHTEIED